MMLNTDVLIPRRSHQHHTWLFRIARWFGGQRNYAANYFYFRSKGYTRSDSRDCAKLTINPQR
jgi:hypothetical protein